MLVTLANDGQDISPLVRITIDNYGVAVDCSGVVGTLIDPTIKRVEWAPRVTAVAAGSTIGSELRDMGIIYRQDGTEQAFADFSLLTPYIDAYNAAKAQGIADQDAFS